jgi:Ser/Thr protein kinase RdoA (MazF antagonist)
MVLEELDDLSARIATRPVPTDDDGAVIEAIATKRALLQWAGDLSPLFQSSPVQVVHGDYHIENVIYDDDRLAGVIDLEGWSTNRIREVYRAIAWSQRTWSPAAIDLPLAWAFVQGYLEEATLMSEELRRGPEMLRWRLLRGLHDLRTYAENPQDSDARDGVIWFVEMAQWLSKHGRELGEELSALGS